MAQQKQAFDRGSISDEAREILKTHQITGKRKLSDWLGLLEELGEFDASTDALRSKTGKIAAVAGVLCIPLVFVTFMTSIMAADSSMPALIPMGVALCLAVALATAIFYLVQYLGYRGVDLPNGFRTSVEPFLRAISEDIPKKGKVSLDLDLRGIQKDKIISKEKIPPGRFNKVIQTIYDDPWCRISAPIADGNTLHMEIRDVCVSHDRHWRKRNRRGKIKFKHKRKWKKTTQVTAALNLNEDELAWDNGRIDALAESNRVKEKQKQGDRIMKVVEKYKYKSISKPPDDSPLGEDLVRIAMKLYSMLAPAGGEEQANV